jgi:hypothetical protein
MPFEASNHKPPSEAPPHGAILGTPLFKSIHHKQSINHKPPLGLVRIQEPAPTLSSSEAIKISMSFEASNPTFEAAVSLVRSSVETIAPQETFRWKNVAERTLLENRRCKNVVGKPSLEERRRKKVLSLENRH